MLDLLSRLLIEEAIMVPFILSEFIGLFLSASTDLSVFLDFMYSVIVREWEEHVIFFSRDNNRSCYILVVTDCDFSTGPSLTRSRCSTLQFSLTVPSM